MSLAIACMSGSFKGVFVHGVLAELEALGLRADAYAAASSSTLPAAYAAIGAVSEVGMRIWTDSLRALDSPETGMSDVVLANIRALSPRLMEDLFQPSASRFLVAASRVVTEEAAAVTQSPAARRLGRKLLLDAARRDSTWPGQHLKPCLFDTRAGSPDHMMNAPNFGEVAYATTRMMHAWAIPASVGGKPYVDASYTCLCPALEVAALGYPDVLAIATEPGPIARGMFTCDTIPDEWNGSRIRVLQPDSDLRDIGVDFTTATAEGLQRAFELGRDKARAFMASR